MLFTGQTYRATLTVKNQEGAPATVALAITRPDGTLVTPPPSLAAGTQAGADWVVTYDYTLPAPGRYEFAWTTTGPSTAPLPDVANVRAFAPLGGFGELKAHLNMTTTTDDDELMAFAMGATELIEDKGGYTVRREFIDRVRRDGEYLRLPRVPVLEVASVTSVWAGGPSYVTAGLLVDGATGRVYLKDGTWFSGGPWDVTYTVGRAVALEKHLHAWKELVRHLWETQRGAMPPSVLGSEETYTTSFGMAFTYPRRVLESLGPSPFYVA